MSSLTTKPERASGIPLKAVVTSSDISLIGRYATAYLMMVPSFLRVESWYTFIVLSLERRKDRYTQRSGLLSSVFPGTSQCTEGTVRKRNFQNLNAFRRWQFCIEYIMTSV